MTAFLSLGGEDYRISVGGQVVTFELHPYCGPTLLDHKGDPADDQPLEFLKAASLWIQQGKRMEDGLCRWDHPSEPITEHLGGRHYLVIGYTMPRRGE